jgi:uncharacterized protein YbgA (DUF1722 family)/uncharacterized protein YbbK (DUF523 family)
MARSREAAVVESAGAEDRIAIGISSCLLGEKVRYDGGHKHDPYITGTLGRFFSFVPVCPEVECGLPVPREAMRLVGDPAAPRLVTIRTRVDHTDRVLAWGGRRLDELEGEDLCGYVFKSRSPSSGMARIKVYDESGMPRPVGVGIWARMFMDRFPLLPVEDEGRLHDPELREGFVERVFVMRRWRDLVSSRVTVGRLVEFHTRHKLLVLAHSPAVYREMGRLVAQGKAMAPAELCDRYLALLAKALGQKATVRKHVNVLQHMMGYFKKQLSADEKQELLEVIDRYGRGLVPLVVPATLVNHYVRKHGQPYLAEQVYLDPHPVELKLRNHA